MLQNIPEEQRRQIASAAAIFVERYSGPVPHPAHFAQFEETLPGSADRMLTMAEKALASNILNSRESRRSDQFYRVLGLLMGFTLMLILVAAAVGFGIYGYNYLASLFSQDRSSLSSACS